MKEQFLQFLKTELERKQQLLTNAAFTDEEKAEIEAVIANLTTTIEAVEAVEDEEKANEVMNDLKTTVAELKEAIEAINEKINAERDDVRDTENEEEEMDKNYLKTQNSVHDFCEAIRNSKNGEEFRANWKAMLVKNDAYSDTVTTDGSDAFLPEAVKGRISDIWDREADWLKSLNFTGAKRFYCRANTSTQSAETSRAKGHAKGDRKAAQKLEFAAKLLDAQFLYKIATLSYETIWDSDDDLLNYILNELTSQILYEVKTCILKGDGRDAADPYKVTKIEAIYKDTTDAYTTVMHVGDAGTTFLLDDIRMLVDAIHNPNGKEVFAFLNKATIRTLSRVQASSTSSPVYMSKEQLAEQLNVTRIIDTDLLADNECICMLPNEYYMVGANILDPVFFSWHDGWTNEDNWREEIVVGGGVNGLKSTAVLLNA